MVFEPFNWNAVVVGAWNRHILTPQWIALNLFGMKEAEPVQVEVPLNLLAPLRVRHDKIAVLAAPDNLEISLTTCDFSVMDLARKTLIHAIEELPKTPFVAAGFNARYRSQEVSSDLASVVRCKADTLLTDAGFSIPSTSLHRSLEFESGSINVDITIQPDEGTSLQFNFHKSSNNPESLKSWLSLPIENVEKAVRQLIEKLPGVEI